MGCTSSAPNSLPINASTADKSIQFEEENYGNPSIEVDVADIEDVNRTNETKVLPSCDTTEEPVQLVRNNKSSKSLDIDKDISANGHVTESEEKTEAPTNTQEEVKIPKLELLMEKVFETNHHLNEDNKVNDKMSEEEISSTDVTEEGESTKNNNEATEANDTELNENEAEKKEEKDADAEEASPSQSQCSRATRWEALADIAAELPPSLAVDPITGQIFQIAQPKRVFVD